MPKNKKLKTLITTIVGLLLIGLGLLALSETTKLLIERNTPVNFDSQISKYSESNKNYPIQLKIDSLNLNLPVTPATINNGKWDDPKHTVGYWDDSSLPGEKGNSVMYGHNWPAVLGNLHKVQKGDVLQVRYLNGTTIDFEVESTFVVTGDQKHILNPTADTRLTIYTCYGFLDSKRFVVVAVPKKL